MILLINLFQSSCKRNTFSFNVQEILKQNSLFCTEHGILCKKREDSSTPFLFLAGNFRGSIQILPDELLAKYYRLTDYIIEGLTHLERVRV